MNSSDIPSEILDAAHTEALEQTPEWQREKMLASNIAGILACILREEGLVLEREETTRIRIKVKNVIECIEDEYGMKYLSNPTYRQAFRNAFYCRIARFTDLPDMTPIAQKHASGEYKLGLLKKTEPRSTTDAPEYPPKKVDSM